MNEALINIHTRVSKLPVFQFIFFITLMGYAGKIILAMLSAAIYVSIGSPGTVGGPTTENTSLVLIVVAGPIIETFLFQMAPIILLQKLTSLPKSLIIVISAVIFGATHYYSVSYIVITFFIGLTYAYSYVVFQRRSGLAFWVTASVHSLHNCLAVVLYYIVES